MRCCNKWMPVSAMTATRRPSLSTAVGSLRSSRIHAAGLGNSGIGAPGSGIQSKLPCQWDTDCSRTGATIWVP